MNYSHFYPKLENEFFTTIRKHNKHKLKVGRCESQFIEERFRFIAKVIKITRRTLATISTRILLADTGCLTRAAAISLIQSFYPKKINYEKDKFYIFTFQRLPKLSHKDKVRRAKLPKAAGLKNFF